MGAINAILVAEKIGFYHKLFGVNLLLEESLNLDKLEGGALACKDRRLT